MESRSTSTQPRTVHDASWAAGILSSTLRAPKVFMSRYLCRRITDINHFCGVPTCKPSYSRTVVGRVVRSCSPLLSLFVVLNPLALEALWDCMGVGLGCGLSRLGPVKPCCYQSCWSWFLCRNNKQAPETQNVISLRAFYACHHHELHSAPLPSTSSSSLSGLQVCKFLLRLQLLLT